MSNATGASIVLLLLCLGAIGCGPDSVPAAPSAVPPTETSSPQPTAFQPTVVTIRPSVGSTAGDTWGTITGTGFQSGASVKFGDTAVRWSIQSSTTIAFWMTSAHAPGPVDVVVTNPGGLSTRVPGGFTYAPPESFDFNGDWIAHAGSEYDTEMRFSIRNNVLVSLSCGADSVALSTFPAVHHGEFSFRDDDGTLVTGTLVSPVTAIGTITTPACANTWWADKGDEP